METQKEESTKAEVEATDSAEATSLDRDADCADDGTAAAQKELLYLKAEFDNYKKRILREQDQAIKFGNERLIRELLGPIDLLELALSHSAPLKEKNDKDVTNFVMGIEMTHRELVQLLSRFGVEFIGVPGEKFDPARHEAVSQVEDPDESKTDTVVEVLQRGSLLQGRLLKPARVVVAKKKDT